MELSPNQTNHNSTGQPSAVGHDNDTFTGLEEPPQLITFRRIVFSFVILLGFFGNVIVVHAIRTGRSRKPFTHYLVTCLALAELSNSVCLAFIFTYEEMFHWVFGSFFCHLIMPSTIVTFSVTTATLAFISMYRYQVVVTPQKKAPSKRICMAVVVGIWIYSFAFALPAFVTTVHQQFPNYPGYYWCTVDPPLRTYQLVRISLQFFAPVIIMIVSYSVASLKIKQHMTFMENRRQSRLNSNLSSLNTYIDSQVNAETNHLSVPPVSIYKQRSPRGSVCHISRIQDPTQAQGGAKRNSCKGEESCMIETERDIIKMFYIIVLVFLLCYIPYQVFVVVEYFGFVSRDTHAHYDLIRNYTFLLISFPSALHPLCYGTMSKFYASAFSKLVLCKCKN